MFRSGRVLNTLVCAYLASLSLQPALIGLVQGEDLPGPSEPGPGQPFQRVLRLDVFVRADSALGQQAIAAAKEFCQERRGVQLFVYDLTSDEEARKVYWSLVKKHGVSKPLLPAFYACHRFRCGYAEREGKAPIAALFSIHAYVRPTCQHCRDATAFLHGLAERWPGVRVAFHDVEHDAKARNEMRAVASRHGVTPTALPGIVLCGRYLSGYRDDATTGRQLEQLLWSASINPPEAAPISQARAPSGFVVVLTHAVMISAPDEQETSGGNGIEAKSDLARFEDPVTGIPSLPPEGSAAEDDEDTYVSPQIVNDEVDLPWIGRISVRDLGLPLFTVAMGLIDGFNPCAMWVLVFLLSVLVNVKDRRKIAAIAGVFVLASGLAYFAFMAAWLNVFLVIDLARPLQIAIGLLALFVGAVNIKDFFAFKRGPTLSIPESAKPGIYERVRKIVAAKYLSVAIGLSVGLALMVNVVELLCTAGLPALYTQILSQQGLPAWKNYAYLALYNVGYIFDDSLMVGAFVITLSHKKMREDQGRWLKLLSGVVVLLLGLLVLFKPEWLQWGGR
jgi:hypothetical protein